MDKKIVMIAGPNGAGKTTTALETLPGLKVYEFLNADAIAKGLAPLHPESVPLAASKLMIKRFRELLNLNKSFAFETTASGKNYVKHLEEARKKNYEISLMFLWLPSPEFAIKRVAERVKQGGHNIPEKTIKNRYFLGIKNLFNHYLILADTVIILDNSSESQKIIARKNSHNIIQIEEVSIWKKMQELADVQIR